MKKRLCLVLSIMLMLSAFAPLQNIIVAEINKNNVQYFSNSVNEIIYKYDSDEEYFSNPEIEQKLIKDRLIVSSDNLSNQYGAVEQINGIGYTILQYANNDSANNAKDILEEEGYTVEYDMVYNCCDVNSTYETSNTWANERIESEETLNTIKSTGNRLSDVTVGVIDTGADYSHPLLANRIEDTSINFSSSGNENDCMDDQGHGTMVSGVIALNTTDNIKIRPYKLVDKNGSCTNSQMIALLTYILDYEDAPDIINMSIGIKINNKTPIFTVLMNQILDKGIIVVAAAGNDNMTVEKQFPANVDGVISVSASDDNNKKCDFSNYGNKIDLAAPGYKVYTSTIGGSYNTVNGTSFSSPFVAAACSTVLMQDATLSAKEVESIVKNSCVRVDNTYTEVKWSGNGILNYTGLYENNLINTPSFSSSSGVYDSEFELSITTSENCKIIYTMDYSLPSLTNGIEYTEPIHISGNKHIIAVAIDGDKHSRYIGETYLVSYTPDESEFTISSSGNITGYTGDKESLTIPKKVNGITVKGIGLSAFKESNVIYIELPETVTLIRQYAFSSSNISTIIALGIEKIEPYAFKSCGKLSYINMPNVIEVGRESFNGCKNLDSVDFNEKVEEIGDLAFANTNYQVAYFPNLMGVSNIFENSNLFSADLPNAEWLSGTFNNCKSLKHVNMPKVTEIDNSCFNRCMNLNELDLSNIEKVGYDGLYGSNFHEIILPNCTELGQSAFSMCQVTKYISIPMVEIVEEHTFNECNSLENVNMVNVKSFGSSISQIYFSNCYKLENIYLPKSNYCPNVYWDNVGVERIESGLEPELKFVYAPNATQTNNKNNGLALFDYCTKLSFAYLPKLDYIREMPNIPNSIWYFSDTMTRLPDNQLADTTGYGYTIVAPTDAYALQWAKQYGHTFIPSEELSFDGTDGENFIYSTPDGKSCYMPIKIVEQMWYDYMPINKQPDFMTHGYLIDVVNDNFINGKDFAKIHHTAKYGW